MYSLGPNSARSHAPPRHPKDGTWYAYKPADGCKAGWTSVARHAPVGRGAERRLRVNWDLTKNICEIYGQTGYIRTLYSYTPYGSVTADGDVTQPIQWSSEFLDSETALSYYNYRYYSAEQGIWLQRDPLFVKQGKYLYNYVNNSPIFLWDVLGEFWGQNQSNFSREEIYVREDIVFVNNPEKSCSKCNRQLSSLVQSASERYYAAQKEQFYNRVKCRLEVTCGCVSVKRAQGEHKPNREENRNGFEIRSGTITIPCVSKDPIRTLYTHELTHAIDTCNMRRPKTCMEILLTEFNSYASAQCATEKDLKSCLREKAFQSAITAKACYDLVGGPILQSNNWTDDDQQKLDTLRDMFDNYLEEYLKKMGR